VIRLPVPGLKRVFAREPDVPPSIFVVHLKHGDLRPRQFEARPGVHGNAVRIEPEHQAVIWAIRCSRHGAGYEATEHVPVTGIAESSGLPERHDLWPDKQVNRGPLKSNCT
jgi:hypothetical protein